MVQSAAFRVGFNENVESFNSTSGEKKDHYLNSLSSATCIYNKSEGFYSRNDAIYAHVASFVKCVILFDNGILKEEWANNG